MLTQKEIDRRNAAIEVDKAAAIDKRNADLLAADYSTAESLDALYDPLSVAEVKLLTTRNASFKNRVAELTKQDFINTFRNYTEAQQQAAYKSYQTQQKKWIDDDYNAYQSAAEAEAAAAAAAPVVPPGDVVVPPADILTPTIDEQAAAQAEADRLAEEARVAAQAPIEKLYDGVEKLADGRYKLTVDPEDGTPVEVFYGATQADCFKALRKSKAQATKELRRRAKQVKITDAMRAFDAEKINYAPLAKVLKLSPDEIFLLTDQTKDPSTVLEATRKLRLASITQEEVDRQNEAVIRQRYSDQFNVAATWMSENENKFYRCDHNINAMKQIMGELNWAVTIANLDQAFKFLEEQGVLLDAPEEVEEVQPVAQPALVVPVAVAVPPAPAAAVVPVATPAPTPAAPAGALPAAPRVLRPGSSSTAMTPTRRVDSISLTPPAAPALVLTAEEYHSIPASTMKIRMQREPAFKAAVEALWATGAV